MKASYLITGLFVAALAVVGWVLASKRQAEKELVHVWSLLRSVTARVETAREENVRLKLQQISAAEFEQLRADHAALPRLRLEIQRLDRTIRAREESQKTSVR